MAEIRRVGSLEISEDLEFERGEWRVERAAWGVILLLLVAGLLGAFGGGILSHAEAESGPLALEYERLARQRAPTELRLRIAPGTATDGDVRIWFDRAYLDLIAIERIEPEPAAAATGEDRVVYRFALVNPSQPAEVMVRYQPVVAGTTTLRLGVVDGVEIGVNQFVYP
jgi:hypothetical protein